MQIFRHVMFWRWTVGSISAAVAPGAEQLRISDVPIDFKMRVGIKGDHTDLLRGLESAEADDEDPLGEALS